jgi:autotransporter-associated beta strand protein
LYNVTVLGRYSPKSTCTGNPKVTLGDATHLSPVLDLFDLSATYDGSRGIAFPEDSTVTVYVGTRTIAVGDKLVSWSSQPDLSVSFALAGDGWTAAEREIALVARGDGLYVKTTVAPTYATLDVANDEWQFFAADGTPYPDEWTDGVTSDMQVRFSSYAEYTAIKAKGVSPSMFVMTGFTMPEGLGEVDATVGMVYQFDEGIVIDIKGNSLKLPAGMMFGEKAFTVTSSVAGGEVVIDIAGGTSRNTAMALSGSLKVTKKGAGTFVSALSQTYTGGTDVEAGTVRPPDAPADGNYAYAGDTFKAFGTGMIDVHSGAVFDVRGNYGYTNVCLKGGSLSNTLRTMSQNPKPGIFAASLAEDSRLDMFCENGKFAGKYGHPSLATDLGGKTLQVIVWNDLSVRSALTNGTVKVVESNGWFRLDEPFDMRTTTFDNQCAIQVNYDVELGTYIQRKNTPYILGSGKMTIHERFVPVSGTYFYGCAMLPGSTLDLSQRDTLFTSSCTNHENKVYSVVFPASGTLNVEVGARRVKTGDQLVRWEAKPVGTAKFTLTRHGAPVVGRSLAVKDDGIYMGMSGVVIIVR